MGFVVAWLCYLLAFALGSLIAWTVVTVSVKATSAQEAFADRAGVPEIGAQ